MDAWNKIIRRKNNQGMMNVLRMIIKMYVKWRTLEPTVCILWQKKKKDLMALVGMKKQVLWSWVLEFEVGGGCVKEEIASYFLRV